MLTLLLCKQFKKDLKRLRKSGSFDESVLKTVVDCLLQRKPLSAKFKDHALKGEMGDYRECHLKPDLLLVYAVFEEELVLQLIRVGSHNQVFKKF